jgi:hypothetical protein
VFFGGPKSSRGIISRTDWRIPAKHGRLIVLGVGQDQVGHFLSGSVQKLRIFWKFFVGIFIGYFFDFLGFFRLFVPFFVILRISGSNFELKFGIF